MNAANEVWIMRRCSYLLMFLLVFTGAVLAQEPQPQTAADYVNRGLAKHRKGDFNGAIADYDRALVLNPGDAATYSHRGAAKDGKRDFEAAITDFNTALSINPNYALAYF